MSTWQQWWQHIGVYSGRWGALSDSEPICALKLLDCSSFVWVCRSALQNHVHASSIDLDFLADLNSLYGILLAHFNFPFERSIWNHTVGVHYSRYRRKWLWQ